MRLSVSNIAWDLSEEPAAADLLKELGVGLVDLAPGKYFEDPRTATDADIARVRQWWEDRGFGVVGLQGLLFGTSGLNLFQDEGEMLSRLQAQCRVAAVLGAGALTFGSPRQRDRSGFSAAEALDIAAGFFARIADAAETHGVAFCLEPVAQASGCNFLTTTLDTAALVRRIDRAGVRLQLDVGAIGANGEDPAQVVPTVAGLVGHVHASEPELAVLGDGGAPHREAGAALRQARPDLPVTLEMARPANEPALVALRRAVRVAQDAYA